jgi:hypothetical protein
MFPVGPGCSIPAALPPSCRAGRPFLLVFSVPVRITHRPPLLNLRCAAPSFSLRFLPTNPNLHAPRPTPGCFVCALRPASHPPGAAYDPSQLSPTFLPPCRASFNRVIRVIPATTHLPPHTNSNRSFSSSRLGAAYGYILLHLGAVCLPPVALPRGLTLSSRFVV